MAGRGWSSVNVCRLAPHQEWELDGRQVVLPAVSVLDLASNTPNKLSWGPILWLSGMTSLIYIWTSDSTG